MGWPSVLSEEGTWSGTVVFEWHYAIQPGIGMQGGRQTLDPALETNIPAGGENRGTGTGKNGRTAGSGGDGREGCDSDVYAG